MGFRNPQEKGHKLQDGTSGSLGVTPTVCSASAKDLRGSSFEVSSRVLSLAIDLPGN